MNNKRNEAEYKRELTGRVTKIIKFTLKIFFLTSSFLFEEANFMNFPSILAIL